MLCRVFTLLIRAAHRLAPVLTEGVIKACEAICRHFHAAAKPAEDTADEPIVKHVGDFKLAVIFPDALPVVDALQNWLHCILEHFFKAFRGERHCNFTGGIVPHLCNSSVDRLIQNAAAERLFERGGYVRKLL